MPPDQDPEAIYHEPNLFLKAFSLVGLLIVVGAFAALIAVVVVGVMGWFRFKYSIFGLGWAICARLFELSVRRGITHNLDTSLITPEKKKMLGEQLIMLGITRWFIRIELLVSALVFLAELLVK